MEKIRNYDGAGEVIKRKPGNVYGCNSLPVSL